MSRQARRQQHTVRARRRAQNPVPLDPHRARGDEPQRQRIEPVLFGQDARAEAFRRVVLTYGNHRLSNDGAFESIWGSTKCTVQP